MNKAVAITILAVISILLFIAGFSPRGQLWPVFLVMLVMFVTAGYFGFISTRKFRYVLVPKFVALILFVTTAWLAWHSYLEQSGIRAISKLVSPYPNISKIVRMPAVSTCQLQHWQIVTEDPIEKVFEFYEQEQNRAGWKMKKAGNFIILSKKDLELVILTAEIHNGADIFYRLEKKQCTPKEAP